MKKFKFRLDVVLKVKKAKEEESLRVLGEVQNLLQNEKNKRNELEKTLQESLLRKEQLGLQQREVSVAAYQLENDFIFGTKQRIVHADRAVQRAFRLVQKAMQNYLQCRRETKKYETLKEQAFIEYKRQASKSEQKQIDEIVTMRFKVKENSFGE